MKKEMYKAGKYSFDVPSECFRINSSTANEIELYGHKTGYMFSCDLIVCICAEDDSYGKIMHMLIQLTNNPEEHQKIISLLSEVNGEGGVNSRFAIGKKLGDYYTIESMVNDRSFIVAAQIDGNVISITVGKNGDDSVTEKQLSKFAYEVLESILENNK